MSILAVSVTSSLQCLGTGVRLVSAELDREGEFAPQAFRLTVEASDLADFNALFNQWRGDTLRNSVIEGILANGHAFSIRLGPNTKAEPQGNRRIRLEFVVQDYTVQTARHQCPGAEYRFRLTNLKIEPVGDEDTEIIQGHRSTGGNPRYVLNKIRFACGGRDWSLSDDAFEAWKDMSASDKNQVLLTGTLSTVATTDDPVVEGEKISKIADDVTFLLSLALARDIKWVTCLCSTPDHAIIKEFSRFLCVSTYEMGGLPPLGNWTRSQLKGFLEEAYAKYSTDREWWLRTLNLFSQVFDTRAADLKAIILNIVLDRASTWILRGKNLGNQIEAGLNAKLDDTDFKQKLHALLSSQTEKWTSQRTDTIVSTIKQWNSSPSFPQKISLAYNEAKLKPPPGKMLSNRHLLLHIGDPPSDGTIFEYSVELECRVLMLLLRLLNYDGQFFHPFFGKPTSLREHLVQE